MKGAKVRFAGKRAKTGRKGRAKMKVRLRKRGVRKVRVTKRGYRAGTARVRVLRRRAMRPRAGPTVPGSATLVGPP